MVRDATHATAWPAAAAAGLRRWEQVLDNIAGMLPRGGCVVVDGSGEQSRTFADRLADTLRSTGRPCSRLSGTSPYADEDAWYADRTAQTITLADGLRWRAHPPRREWDVVIWLRTPPVDHGHGETDRGAEAGADIVVDLHDPAWPVIRHVAVSLAGRGRWYISETQAFFGPRAATWDSRFGDDLPAYAAAIAESGLPRDGVVIDVGCGTGRALPALRRAVGPQGVVIAIDLTQAMLAQAGAAGRAAHGSLVVADARHLPLADACVDGVFAAGLIMHLPDTVAGLRELGRVTRPGGLLTLFHPSGRAALAARHGRALKPDDPLAETPLREAMTCAGWSLGGYDDPPHRFFARGSRTA